MQQPEYRFQCIVLLLGILQGYAFIQTKRRWTRHQIVPTLKYKCLRLNLHCGINLSMVYYGDTRNVIRIVTEKLFGTAD